MLIVDKEGRNEDTVMEDSLEQVLLIFRQMEMHLIETAPEDFSAVLDALTNKGYEFISAEVEMVPSTYTEITDDEIAVKMQKLLDSLEDNDDVQNVWHNWENPLDA
ncbi:MAG: YebC/PmpR family DNA-binding transcriptional regulator [Acutalibacteraceae bacterium]